MAVHVFSAFILVAFLCKLIFWFSGLPIAFNGGSDAIYYNAYALGQVDYAVNFWPIFLRFLNSWGFYNRTGVSFAVFISSSILIPILFSSIIQSRLGWRLNIYSFISILLVSVYPSIIFFSFDIFRDVVMISFFLLAILSIKNYFYLKPSFFHFIYFFIVASIVFLFRPYLGFSLFAAYFVFLITPAFIVRKKPLLFSIYLLFLIALYSFGILDPLVMYRGEDGFDAGTSSLGIGLIGKNPLEFFVLFLVSFLAQVFGFFINSASAFILFVFESVPFIAAIIFVFKNLRYANRYVDFLLFFFLIYSTIWVIGNDNLGTAMRLRIPSYLAIFACALIMHRLKAADREKVSE